MTNTTQSARPIRRILVIAPSWVGDAVMSEPLLAALKQDAQPSHITVFAPPWCMPIYARMHAVDATLSNPFPHGLFGLGARWRLGRSLRGQFDVAYVLPNSWKSALLPWFAGVAQRIGYLGEMRYGLLTQALRLDSVHHPLMVQRYLALHPEHRHASASPCPEPKLQTQAAQQQALLQKLSALGVQTEQRRVIFCPGAEYGPAKRWPAAHFAALAALLQQQGFQVLLLGAAKDQAVAQAICAQAPQCLDLCGQTSLDEAIDLLATAHAVVSNDSGLMHITAALNRPLVAIFGSSSPEFTPPMSALARIVSLDLDCSPCFARDCPLGTTACLQNISPAQVLKCITLNHSAGDK